MKLPIYCISDNHFSIVKSEYETIRRNKLFSLFKKIKETGGTLIIGGDFFDFWFDYKNHHPNYNSLFSNLSDLNKAGIEIHYVLGNHDYWDFGYFTKSFNAKVYNNDLQYVLSNGKKLLFTHGDGLLKSDISYRFMKKIIRSKICIFLFKSLGQKIGYKIAQLISNTSAHYHHHDDRADMIISEICSTMAKYTKQYKYILVGHYHQIGIYDLDGAKIIFMGDWLNKCTLSIYNGEKWVQEEWDK